MITSKRLTRRDFLKKGATVAVAATGVISAGSAIKTDAQSVQKQSGRIAVNFNGKRYWMPLCDDN